MYAMTAAHRNLPIPSYAKVTNLRNGRNVVVKINDRGPFNRNRLIDLSYAAAKKLGVTGSGTGYVEIRALNSKNDFGTKLASNDPIIETKATHKETKSTHREITHQKDTYIQVASLKHRQAANHLKHRIAQLTHQPVYIHKVRHGKSFTYKVNIGPIKSQEQNKLMAKLAHAGFNKVTKVG
jgi:rare lipoprotein A